MKAKLFSKVFSMIVMLVMVFGIAQPTAADNPKPSTIPTINSNPKGLATQRYIVVAKTASFFSGLESASAEVGASVVAKMPETNMLVVSSKTDIQAKLKRLPGVQSVAKDQVRSLINPQNAAEMGFNTSPQRIRIAMDKAGKAVSPSAVTIPDPAHSLAGLMWNQDRIKAPTAWNNMKTNPDTVYVGVADTGLDYTHSELKDQVVAVVDFTDSLCYDYYGASDADWAALYEGPANTDWNGHGSWIGGNIAASLDGVGINGIAPNVKLVALKISQWCGSAWDSSILMAFYYAAINKLDIVSISFGGYLDRSDPDQDDIYQDYVDVVKYAAQKGTTIVAAAGNEHAQIGPGGKVQSHGVQMSFGSSTLTDYYGLYENPGGIPGVVDVAATGNIVNAASSSCDPSKIGKWSDFGATATCKPTSDAHPVFGSGKLNQLAYYSNYGPRIDVAAPGGARMFNLPSGDRGGTAGWPVVDVGNYNAWETFSITSNWALQITCYYWGASESPYFYPDECYSNIQGTSMATPHVSAALAMIASQNAKARHNPAKLISILKKGAQKIKGNMTPPLSATDLSKGDLAGVTCPTGYCHLGGKAISDKWAYGAGLVDASKWK